MLRLLTVGAGVLAGSGALALVFRPASPDAGSASLFGGYGPADDVTYAYCPAEFRITPHLTGPDEAARCWNCPEGEDLMTVENAGSVTLHAAEVDDPPFGRPVLPSPEGGERGE